MSDTLPNVLPWSAEKWKQFYTENLIGLERQLGLPEMADIDAIAFELSILIQNPDRWGNTKPFPSRPLHCDFALVPKTDNP